MGSKWQGPSFCPICKSNNWSVSRELYELRPFADGNIRLGEIGVAPVVPVTCATCGNTLLI
ncbi:MAG: hypothetical protein EOP85_09370, partial [Verrucomicrobiaceae bacterium]